MLVSEATRSLHSDPVGRDTDSDSVNFNMGADHPVF